jgi:uncharacterized Ntn-hydrolase superfamily protein
VTFSLLVRDPDSGAFGGAAATGNLCVGAWVLRGDARAGLTAAQGLYPSPMWGPEALELMSAGRDAADAVRQVVERDSGRAVRQLAALDRNGGTGVHSGAKNLDYCGHVAADNLIAAGNMLQSRAVLEAMVEAFASATGTLSARLIAGLAAGATAGGDVRGLLSAAILVLSPDAAPLDLRIDHAGDPIGALNALYERTGDPAYQDWLAGIPTLNDPERSP